MTLATFGYLAYDTHAVPHDALRHGDSVRGSVRRDLGGCAAIAAANAAAGVGVPTVFVGFRGADRAGELAGALLETRGVVLRTVAAGASAQVVIMVDEFGERTMVIDDGDAFRVSAADVDPSWFEGVTALHMEGWYLFDSSTAPLCARVCEMAHAAGAIVSLDASSSGRIATIGRLEYLARLATVRPDLLLANAQEAEILKLENSVPPGVEMTIVHRGRLPTVVRSRAHRQVIDLDDVVERPLSTCGAGDTFAGGLMAVLSQRRAGGETPSVDQVGEAVLVAQRLAAQVVRTAGSLLKPGDLPEI